MYTMASSCSLLINLQKRKKLKKSMKQTPSSSFEQEKETSEQKKRKKKRKETTRFWERFSHFLRNGFVLSKTVFFIVGLALSYTLVRKTVVDVLVDFLIEDVDFTLREAIVLTDMLDLVSAVFRFGVAHLEAYSGPFSVIIFCTAAYIMGLMLLWLRTSWLILATVLIALGKTGEAPLRELFDYQLSEKLREKCTHNNKREYNKESPANSNNLWRTTAYFTGSLIAVFWLGAIDEWSEKFKVSSLVMGSTHLLFFCGSCCYYLKASLTVSPLTTIYKVLKAALQNCRVPYPSSNKDYNYRGNALQGSNESEESRPRGIPQTTTICRRENDEGHNEGSNNEMEDPFYRRENGKVHVLPREASFCFLLFLDKAAIIRNNNKFDDAEGKKKYEESCTAEQVRDVKSLYLIIPLSFTFVAYCLTFASRNTYFVMQMQNLNPKVGGFHVPVVAFFALKSLVAFVVRPIRKLMKPTWSIAVGMFCSGLCCIAALLLEKRRMYLIKPFKDEPERIIPLSIMVLTPQYFLLGLMEGFAEYGVDEFLWDAVPKSMKNFVGPSIQMLLAIGNFSSVLSVLIFRRWIKDSINYSHLDRYFLMLAPLNFLFFGAYVCCVKFKLLKLPQVDEPSQTHQGPREVRDPLKLLVDNINS